MTKASIIFLAMLPLSGWAQTPMSLKEAVHVALEKNQSIVASNAFTSERARAGSLKHALVFCQRSIIQNRGHAVITQSSFFPLSSHSISSKKVTLCSGPSIGPIFSITFNLGSRRISHFMMRVRRSMLSGRPS